MKLVRLFAGLFFAAILFVLLAAASTADDPLEKIITGFNAWWSAHPQEKVYLQMDKPHYTAGEEIWFKAYVTIGSEHKLSALSGVLNVELVDDRDSVKQHIKLPLISGLSWGDLQLPDTLKEGNYRVRAYTNWMRNAGADYFFDQAITVSNTVSNDVFTHTTYTYSLQNGRQGVTATINYANLNGAPYSNSPVNYEVLLGGKKILSDDAVTDDKGNINVSFTNPSAQALHAGRIITTIKPGGQKSIEKTILVKAASSNTDVQFFPEGGSLVAGIETRVAFKAVAADGLGADVKGVVTDDSGNQVAAA